MINTDQLDAMISELRTRLGAGLLATDVWERETKRSLAGYESQPAAVELMDGLVKGVEQSLLGSGFPTIKNYVVMELETDKAVIVIKHGSDLFQGMLLDTRYANMGVVLSLGLRTAIQGVQKAR